MSPFKFVLSHLLYLVRMMKGEVNAQQAKVKSLTGLVGTAEATRDEWAASLPFAFIWLDFLSA